MQLYVMLALRVLTLSDAAGGSVLIRQEVGIGVEKYACVGTDAVRVLHQMESCSR